MTQDLQATRPTRRPRNSLTVEAILDAGEQVAAAGFDALTIRAVAVQLGSSPMALYRYFTTKDELVDALLNRVLGQFEHGAPTGDWLADLRVFALSHRAMLTTNRWAVGPLIANPYPGPNAVPIGEEALLILARGGVIGDRAVATFSGIVALNYGWESFVGSREGAGGQRAVNDITSGAADADDFPLTADVADPMSRYGSDEHYGMVLNQMLTGVAAAAPA
jgi:hypothetical protein